MRNKSVSVKLTSVLLAVLMLSTVFAPAVFAETDASLLPAGYRVTQETTYRVVSGITERHFTMNNETNSNQIKNFTMEVDLSNPDLSIVAGYNDGDADTWGRMTVLKQAAAMEKKLNTKVVGGINADFFNKENGAPSGILVMGGKNWHAAGNEPYFAILKDGKTAVIRTAKESADDVQEAVGGNAILVKGGKVVLDNTDYLAPRSAVGIKADGSVVFFECDGRQAPDSCGMNNGELAHTMLALGCVDALSLDGGGSATFCTRRESDNELATRNKPCYLSDRPVSTSLLICSSAKATNVFDHVAFSTDTYRCNPKSSVKLDPRGVDANGFSTSLPKGDLVISDESLGKMSGKRFRASGVEGTVEVNYVIDGIVYGTTTIEISKDADDAVTAFFKNIVQTFLNLFQLMQFALEKISSGNWRI